MLENAAAEPEVADLAAMLNASAGLSNRIRVFARLAEKKKKKKGALTVVKTTRDLLYGKLLVVERDEAVE